MYPWFSSGIVCPDAHTPDTHTGCHVRHRVPHLLLPHSEHGRRILDPATRHGIWPPLQRIWSLRDHNAIGNSGTVAEVRLSNYTSRHRCYASTHDWPSTALAQGKTSLHRPIDLAQNRLVVDQASALLDLHRVEPADGAGILLPISVLALIRNIDGTECCKRRSSSHRHECFASARSVHLWLPLRLPGATGHSHHILSPDCFDRHLQLMGSCSVDRPVDRIRNAVRILRRWIYRLVGEDGHGGERRADRSPGDVQCLQLW